MAVRNDFSSGEVLTAADLNDTFASKLPYSYGTATPSTTVDGFLWYDENDTPPTPKFWDGSAFQPITGTYETWSPTFSNLTIGNGTVTARYTQVGKMVHLWMRVLWGSTTSSGSGVIVTNLPVNAQSNDAMVAANVWMHFVDDSAGTFHWGTSHSSNNNATRIWITPTTLSGTIGAIRVNQDVTASNPFTWTTGDRWFMSAIYEGA